MKVLKWLDNNLEQAILLILLCGMTIVMGGQIIARYAFSASLSWSEEITRYMFIISGFLEPGALGTYLFIYFPSFVLTTLYHLLLALSRGEC